MLTTRAVAFLGAATVVVVGAAAITTHWRQSATLTSVSRDQLFPDLAERLDGVTEVRIERGPANEAGAVTITQKDGAWRVEELSGYPARVDSLRELMVGLADLETVEAKTRDADRYDRLALSDVTREGSKASRLVVKGRGEEVLLDALFGDRRASLSGGSDMIYTRRSGEEQSWLAKGDVDLRGGPTAWVDRVIADVKRDDVLLGRFIAPDGATLELVRDPSNGVVTITDLPATREPKSVMGPDGVLGVLEKLELEGVRPADQVVVSDDLGSAYLVIAEGYTIIARFAADGDALWVRFSAETGQASEEAAKKTVESLTARWSGWAYRVSDFRLARLRETMASLTRPKAS